MLRLPLLMILLSSCVPGYPNLVPEERHEALEPIKRVYWMPTGRVEIVTREISMNEDGDSVARIELVVQNDLEKRGWILRVEDQRLEVPGDRWRTPVFVKSSLGAKTGQPIPIAPGSSVALTLEYELSRFEMRALGFRGKAAPALFVHWEVETPQGTVREVGVFDGAVKVAGIDRAARVDSN